MVSGTVVVVEAGAVTGAWVVDEPAGLITVPLVVVGMALVVVEPYTEVAFVRVDMDIVPVDTAH